MRTTGRFLLALLGCLFLASESVTKSAPQITPLYRFSCSAATWPACGLNLVPENQYHRKTFLPTGGPQGQSATLIEHLQADHQFQYYFGFGGIPNLAPVPQGAKRVFRERLYIEPGVNLAGNQGPWSAKSWIVADGQNIGTNRIIGHYGVGGTNDIDFYVGASRNIDGGIYAAGGPPLAPGRWHYIQYEFQSSTTATSPDGYIRVEINGVWNRSGNFVFTTQGWNTFAWGRISQTTLAMGAGRLAYKIANDWEWDDEIDPNWSQGGSQTFACSDGQDNDKDTFTDLADPGCTSPTDTDETNDPPQGCTFTIVPTSATVSAASTIVNVQVASSAPSCVTYSVTPNVPWLTVASSGFSVSVAVASNSNSARTGTATIAGHPFTVNQAASTSVSAPTVASVAPNTGPLAGGTAAVITGANFVAGAGRVLIGGVQASVQSLTGSTELRVTIPPGISAGAKDVIVRNPDGQEGVCVGCFTYQVADPCVTTPLVIDQVSWPLANTGRRSLTFRSNLPWSQFLLGWPNTLTVTDTRGCVRTVMR